jgi:hypothetical protein
MLRACYQVKGFMVISVYGIDFNVQIAVVGKPILQWKFPVALSLLLWVSCLRPFKRRLTCTRASVPDFQW